MARFSAQSATVYKDELDISGISNGIAIVADNIVVPVTAFSDTDFTYVEGKPGFTMDYNVLNSLATPAWDTAALGDLGVDDQAIGVFPQGTTAGNLCYEGIADISRAPIEMRTNQAIMRSINWAGNKALVPGRSHYVNTALTATVNTTGQQIGAVTASNKMVIVIRVISVSGSSPTLDAVVKSDDNSGFTSATTRHTFSQMTAASHFVGDMTATVTDDWWRVAITIGGTNPSFSVLISMGVVADVV